MSNIYLIVHISTNHTRLISLSSAISPHTEDRRTEENEIYEI